MTLKLTFTAILSVSLLANHLLTDRRYKYSVVPEPGAYAAFIGLIS